MIDYLVGIQSPKIIKLDEFRDRKYAENLEQRAETADLAKAA